MNNRYGLDASYFSSKMSRIIRDIGSYKPDEFARECARMSRTADESVMREQEFAPTPSTPGTGSDALDCILGVGGFASFGPLDAQPAAHLTIPGTLEWHQLPEPVEIEYPEYSEQGMGCGLEDRGITDRYEAMRYGYDEALDQFARILDGYGPLYTHADTHGVVGTHSADGESRADGEPSELERLKEKLEAIRARPNSIDHSAGAKIPNALDAWGRPVPQYLPYDFSGNPGASATQYCNGWNDSGSYWKNHVIDIEAQLANTEQSRRSFFDLSQDLERKLEEAKRLLHTASIRLALWLTPGDDPRKQIIAFLSGDEPPKTQVQKACPVCDGWGTISTGIDEAPSTNCKKCDGTGKGVAP
jgi:hypothetical protein